MKIKTKTNESYNFRAQREKVSSPGKLLAIRFYFMIRVIWHKTIRTKPTILMILSLQNFAPTLILPAFVYYGAQFYITFMNLPQFKGDMRTMSIIACDKVMPLTDALPLMSDCISLQLSATLLVICSEHISSRLFVEVPVLIDLFSISGKYL